MSMDWNPCPWTDWLRAALAPLPLPLRRVTAPAGPVQACTYQLLQRVRIITYSVVLAHCSKLKPVPRTVCLGEPPLICRHWVLRGARAEEAGGGGRWGGCTWGLEKGGPFAAGPASRGGEGNRGGTSSAPGGAGRGGTPAAAGDPPKRTDLPFPPAVSRGGGLDARFCARGAHRRACELGAEGRGAAVGGAGGRARG